MITIITQHMDAFLKMANIIAILYAAYKFTKRPQETLSERIDALEEKVEKLETEVDLRQKDFEQQFNIRRSTASNILALIEKNGLIQRESVPYDARLKKIVLTDKAIEKIAQKAFDKIEEYKDFGGIRIEDDVLITADGCRFLGKHLIPYHTADVEAYIAEHRND